MGIIWENNVGNFIIHFEVEFPDQLLEETREKLKDLLI